MNSYNLSAAKPDLDADVSNVLQTVARPSINRDWPACPPILLGAGSLSPVEIATMYQTIASDGFSTLSRGIHSVLTADSQPLKRYPFQVEQRFDSGAVYLAQNAIQRVMREGTGRSVYSQLPSSLTLAGKAGTSDGSRDSWFSGFDGDPRVMVWLGRDDNSKTPLTGATGALQVWASFTRRAHPQSLETPIPENVMMTRVDTQTEQGSTADYPNAVQMPYVRGSEPAQGSGCGSRNPANEVMDWVRDWLN